MYVCRYVRMYVCMYVCMYMYVSMCTHAYNICKSVHNKHTFIYVHEWMDGCEENPVFEHEFSIKMHGLGVKMGYLHDAIFTHIGTDTSAYVLNGFFRPWDT